MTDRSSLPPTDTQQLRTRLIALYTECQQLRDQLGIQGMPGLNLFDNGLGWDGDLDHELLVIADGLGGATLLLLDQGCQTHSKRFACEDEALEIAIGLLSTAQGMAEDKPLTVDDIHWDD